MVGKRCARIWPFEEQLGWTNILGNWQIVTVQTQVSEEHCSNLNVRLRPLLVLDSLLLD